MIRRLSLLGCACLAIAVALRVVVSPSEGEQWVVAGDRAGFSPGGYRIMRVPDAQLSEDMDAMAASKARWVRFDFAWASAEPARGTFDWSAIDRVVTAAQARDLKVVAVLAYSPAWARPLGATDKHQPNDVADFARFAEQAARRYSTTGVHVYEIWNEPNVVTFWQPNPDPVAYARLLRAASAAIRAVDPQAVVLTGGTAPAADRVDKLSIAPKTFIEELYTAGAADSFDAVGVHPYSYPVLPDFAHDENAFANLPNIREMMVSHGDVDKKIWGTEYGAPTGTSSRAVSEQLQADMVTQGYTIWQSWSDWTGPLLWYANRDYGSDLGDPEENFGLRRFDGSPKPAAAAFNALFADNPA